eukprot:11193064-Lingulodinium_polyedra.AAC.1
MRALSGRNAQVMAPSCAPPRRWFEGGGALPAYVSREGCAAGTQTWRNAGARYFGRLGGA